jgi:hypothetical protein
MHERLWLSAQADFALPLLAHEGESCGSVAARMAVPIGTVYRRLYQAKRQFRRAIEAQLAAKDVPRALGKAGGAMKRRDMRARVRAVEALLKEHAGGPVRRACRVGRLRKIQKPRTRRSDHTLSAS